MRPRQPSQWAGSILIRANTLAAMKPSMAGYSAPDGPQWAGEGSMEFATGMSSAGRSEILARLRTLRASLARARDALMHYKDDRLDRDKLEPAARRADQLMDMFASSVRDTAQGSLWVTEIQTEVERVTNPKAAEALRAAQVDITALLDVLESEEDGTHGSVSGRARAGGPK